MELYQLEYFLEVARQGNFTRAAEHLHLAQPALSEQMKKLESELGTELFVRTRLRTRLTVAGDALHQRAEAMLEMARDARRAVADIASLKRGRLVIASIPTLSGCWLPGVIAQFRQRHGGIDITLLEESSERVAEAIASGNAEIGFLQLPTDTKRFTVHELIREPFVLLMHQDVCPAKVAVRLKDFREHSFLIYKGRAREVAIQACRDAGFEPQIACESSELETIRALVNARMGVALLPKLAASVPLLPTLRALPLANPKVERELGWIHQKKQTLSGAAQAFANLIFNQLLVSPPK